MCTKIRIEFNKSFIKLIAALLLQVCLNKAGTIDIALPFHNVKDRHNIFKYLRYKKFSKYKVSIKFNTNFTRENNIV